MGTRHASGSDLAISELHWRPSTSILGSPGSTDATSFSEWSHNHVISSDTSDEDSDGVVNLLEYFHGSNPTIPNTQPILGAFLASSFNGEPTLMITFSKDPQAEDVICIPEFSEDLIVWHSNVLRTAVQPNNNGLQTEVWRSITPLTNSTQAFARLRIHRRPSP